MNVQTLNGFLICTKPDKPAVNPSMPFAVASVGVNELVVIACVQKEWVGRHVVFAAGKAEPMNIQGKNVIVIKIEDVVAYWSV